LTRLLGRFSQQNFDVFQAAMLRDHEALVEQIPALGEAGIWWAAVEIALFAG
jgi:hypothetical protein